MNMNRNRMEGFVARQTAAGRHEANHPVPPAETSDYPALVKAWVVEHPLPCLAAAFFAGVAIAWIVKRK